MVERHVGEFSQLLSVLQPALGELQFVSMADLTSTVVT